MHQGVGFNDKLAVTSKTKEHETHSCRVPRVYAYTFNFVKFTIGVQPVMYTHKGSVVHEAELIFL